LYRIISSDNPRQMMADRGARRRERTRASLLEGARRVIAEKGFDAATITEITGAADVGFGSFYNHFQSKDELLKVLVTDAVEAHGRAIDGLMAEESDPARLVAAGVLHTVAMAEHDPFWAWFMVRTGFGEHSELGAPLLIRLFRDVGSGAASGRFPIDDVTTAVAAVSGATWAVIRARLAGAAAPEAGRLLAEGALRLLGLRAAEARRVVATVVALHLTEAVS
jgi:AcrR family transcriptional regulator